MNTDSEVGYWNDLVLAMPAEALRTGEGIYAIVEIWDQDSGALLDQWFSESFDVYR